MYIVKSISEGWKIDITLNCYEKKSHNISN